MKAKKNNVYVYIVIVFVIRSLFYIKIKYLKYYLFDFLYLNILFVIDSYKRVKT